MSHTETEPSLLSGIFVQYLHTCLNGNDKLLDATIPELTLVNSIDQSRLGESNIRLDSCGDLPPFMEAFGFIKEFTSAHHWPYSELEGLSNPSAHANFLYNQFLH